MNFAEEVLQKEKVWMLIAQYESSFIPLNMVIRAS